MTSSTKRRLATVGATLMLTAAVTACGDRDAPRPVSELQGGQGEDDRPLASHGASSAPDVRAVRATPPTAPATDVLPAGLPDPAEAGIGDLPRLARYVFREMQRPGACVLSNPFHDTLSFAIETEVKGGRIVRARLGEASLERGTQRLPLPGGAPPPELVAYVECLRPSLEGLSMDPTPADGQYQPVYAYPGHVGP